jgi:hypothetical protein
MINKTSGELLRLTGCFYSNIPIWFLLAIKMVHQGVMDHVLPQSGVVV